MKSELPDFAFTSLRISRLSVHRTRKKPFRVTLKSWSFTFGMSLMSIPIGSKVYNFRFHALNSSKNNYSSCHAWISKRSTVYSCLCLKVPKCKIFDILDSYDFCTIKPQRVGDFETLINNGKAFRFSFDFEVCRRNF
jgi:hypothetical protein